MFKFDDSFDVLCVNMIEVYFSAFGRRFWICFENVLMLYVPIAKIGKYKTKLHLLTFKVGRVGEKL